MDEQNRIDRFRSLVDRQSVDDCWPWKGPKHHAGYGLFSTRRATHVALELAGHERPVGAFALHSCDNPSCCNPAHLRWGTAAENAADMVSRGRHHAQRRTHCKHGHPLSGDTLIVLRNGQRRCKPCQYASQGKYLQKRREATHAA